MPGRKNDALTVLRRRLRVADAYCRGDRQVDIALREGVDRTTVSRDLARVRQEWLERAMEAHDKQVAEELARLDNLEREYWAAWELSKAARETTSIKRGRGADEQPGRGHVEVTRRTEQRDGNPAFLNGVGACIDRRCKLLGLDAPTKVDIEMEVRQMAERAGMDPDEAVAEVERMLREEW
jgi:hypothetical protein